MEPGPFYIDQEGHVIQYEGISSHIGIAIEHLKHNPKLRKEFEESGIKYETDFLVQKLGFIQVTDETGNGFYNKKILFSGSLATPIQKRIIMGYVEEGFRVENIDKTLQEGSVVKRFHDFGDGGENR